MIVSNTFLKFVLLIVSNVPVYENYALKKGIVGGKGVSAAHASRLIDSFDSSRGACVDASSALGAYIGVDDSDVSNGDGR